MSLGARDEHRVGGLDTGGQGRWQEDQSALRRAVVGYELLTMVSLLLSAQATAE